jgi:DNA-directed RNA polymerase subunit M/transcription elongation factor TFIIS
MIYCPDCTYMMELEVFYGNNGVFAAYVCTHCGYWEKANE